jgi:hypothetical protein
MRYEREVTPRRQAPGKQLGAHWTDDGVICALDDPVVACWPGPDKSFDRGPNRAPDVLRLRGMSRER